MIKTIAPAPVAVLVAAAILTCVLPSTVAGQTGSIRGIIVDEANLRIPAAYLYLSSPSLIATLNYISTDNGSFWFGSLPAGIYTLMTEKPGHKTVTIEGIFISPGQSAVVEVQLQTTEIEEEQEAHPFRRGLDPISAANVSAVDLDLLSRMPIPRDFSYVLGLVPGAVFESGLPGEYASIHGGPAGGNIVAMDGTAVSDPVTGAIMPRINLGVIDEIIVETAAHSVDRGPADSGYINIIPRSGGETGSGEISVYHTGKALSDSLFSPDELEDMGIMAPASDKRFWDFSLSAGGPLISDLARIFVNLRVLSRQRTTPFTAWADPLGTMHWDYFFDNSDISGLVKLSARVEGRYSGYMEVSSSRIHESVYEPDISRTRPLESTRFLDKETFTLARAGFNYILNQNVLLSLSSGYSSFKQPLIMNSLGAYESRYIDLGSGYVWGSAGFNSLTKNGRFTGAALMTLFEDRALGAAHEIKLGAEYETMTGRSSVWKLDNLTYLYSSGDPYLYGPAVSPESGNTVGLGLIEFAMVPWEQGGLAPKKDLMRFGFFLQDSLTFARRFALTLGLRFDRSQVDIPSYSKGVSGNGVSTVLGEALVQPLIGINPFVQALLVSWREIITWNTFSPRASMSVDLFGDGKTLLKASFARYPEYLGLGYSELLIPIDPNRSHQFYWYDEDEDALVDEDDTYVLVPEDYRIYLQEFYENRIDPALKPPMTDEWTVGLEREIGNGFSLSLRAISKTKSNIVGRVLYDPDTDTAWHTPDGAAAAWWIPFQTTVPGTDEYPETPVTVYFPAEDAPAFFDRIQNVPELRRKYRALEFSLRKRWAGQWQLAGSVVLGRATGTSHLAPGLSSGIATDALTPNAFINLDESSHLDLDRPLSFKLMGTARLPWDVSLSLYFRASSGAPWSRSVTVIPPETWTVANGAQAVPATVILESPGERRRESWKNLDLGLSREFGDKDKTRLAVSLDVLNVLGDTTRLLNLNDGGLWYPSEEGTAVGERIFSETYGKVLSVWGTRTFALKIELKF